MTNVWKHIFSMLLVLLFASGCINREVVFSYTNLSSNEIWITDIVGLPVFSRPIDETSYLAELCLFRDQKTYVIPRQPGESWENFIVSSGTNKAFALVRAKQDDTPFAFTKLVELTLPETNQPLNSVELDTLFTMDTLAVDRGESWVGRIEGVTSDGRRLLLARSFPYPLTASETGWRYRSVIYDVENGEFVNPTFETDSHILKTERNQRTKP